MTAAQVIWLATLVIIAIVVVPLAVALLKRAWRAADSIERYLADMHAAGTEIAREGAAIESLAHCAAKAEHLPGSKPMPGVRP